MKKINILLASLLVCVMACAQQHSVDQHGNTVFTCTIEGLSLSASDIHRAAVKHIEDAYKDARYNITENNPAQGTVVGEARLNSIHEQGGLLSSQLFSATVKLRVDVKDGRARIRLITRNYTLKNLSDIDKGQEGEILISQCEPVGSVYSGKGYKKAFANLSAIAVKLLAAAERDIRNATPADTNDDW